MSASDLCKGISYDAGAMTRMLDRLEEKGLIQPHPQRPRPAPDEPGADGGGPRGVSAHARDLHAGGQPLPARLYEATKRGSWRAPQPHARKRPARRRHGRARRGAEFFWADVCLGIIRRGSDGAGSHLGQKSAHMSTRTVTTVHQGPPALALARHAAGGGGGRRRRVGRLLGAGAALSPEHRRCLRRRQRGADHPADLRHGGRDRRRRHAVRQGRPDAGAARPGGRARSRSTRPKRSSRAPCATCATCSPPARSSRRPCSSAQTDLQRGAERSRPAQRASATPARSRARNCSTRVDAVKAAQAALLAARQQLAANRARVDGTTLENHPQVRDAAAAVRNAYLTLARTELPAPVAGFVARRNVQLGQRVGPGTAADGGRAARPGVGGCQLQGAAARAHARRPAGEAHRRPVRHARRLSRQGRRLRRRHRRGVRAAAGAECHRQLDQDRAARAGAHRARPARDCQPPAADRPVDEGRRGRAATAQADARLPQLASTAASWSTRCVRVRAMRRPTRACRRSSRPTSRRRRGHWRAARAGAAAGGAPPPRANACTD